MNSISQYKTKWATDLVIYKVSLLGLFIWLNFNLAAQQPLDSLSLTNDSLNVNIADTASILQKDTLPFKPKRATLLSAAVPGLGQAYNKQLYKVPIYPGVMLLSFSAHLRYIKLFDGYSEELAKLSSPLVNTSGDRALRNAYRVKQEQSRKIANASLAMGGFFYVANVIDAYASAGIKNKKVEGQHSPLLSAYRSAAFPGLGQLYNKQYWKAPVFWAALAGTGFFVTYTYQRRKCYGDVYLNRVRYNYVDEDLLDQCFSNPNRVRNSPDSEFLRLREFHKKNYERALIAMGAVYLLNIADAMVYGHLKNFDIDDNLDLSVKPVFHYQPNDVSFAGLGIVLKL